VIEIFLSVNVSQSYKQERGCLVHLARVANTPLKDGESARGRFDRITVVSLWTRFFGPPCIFVKLPLLNSNYTELHCNSRVGEAIIEFHQPVSGRSAVDIHGRVTLIAGQLRSSTHRRRR